MRKLMSIILVMAIAIAILGSIKVSAKTNAEIASIPNCTITQFDTEQQKYVEKTGRYEGYWKNGKPHGKGTFTLKDSSGYEYKLTGKFTKGQIKSCDITYKDYRDYSEHQVYTKGENGKYVYSHGKTVYRYNANSDKIKNEFKLVGDTLYVFSTNMSNGWKNANHYEIGVGVMDKNITERINSGESVVLHQPFNNIELTNDDVITISQFALNKTSAIKKLVNSDVTAKELKSDASKYKDCVVKVKNLTVVETYTSVGAALVELQYKGTTYYLYVDTNGIEDKASEILGVGYKSTWYFTPITNVTDNNKKKAIVGIAYPVLKKK